MIGVGAKVITQWFGGAVLAAVREASMGPFWKTGLRMKQTARESIKYVDDIPATVTRDAKGRIRRAPTPAGYRLVSKRDALAEVAPGKWRMVGGKSWYWRKPSPRGTPPHTHATKRKGIRDYIDCARDDKAGQVLVGLLKSPGVMRFHETGRGKLPARPFLVPAAKHVCGFLMRWMVSLPLAMTRSGRRIRK